LSTDEQTPSGSVPNTFGNALAWKWVPSMPAALKRAHVHTLLYALRSMASASGELRFADRKPMRIKDIARAAGCDEKDCRDRLEASIRAGVVKALGERRRGRSALYVILPTPFPDWPAAVAYLNGAKAAREEARARRDTGRKAAPWTEENGGRSPELDEPENGGPPPELTDGNENGERGTAPRMRTGDRPPFGSGDRPPNNPGEFPGTSHDGAEVSFQPQVVGRSGDQSESQEPNPDDHTTWTRCTECGRPILPNPKRPGRTVHARCEPTTTHQPERHSA
jgi:hypothetical protein